MQALETMNALEFVDRMAETGLTAKQSGALMRMIAEPVSIPQLAAKMKIKRPDSKSLIGMLKRKNLIIHIAGAGYRATAKGESLISKILKP